MQKSPTSYPIDTPLVRFRKPDRLFRATLFESNLSKIKPLWHAMHQHPIYLSRTYWMFKGLEELLGKLLASVFILVNIPVLCHYSLPSKMYLLWFCSAFKPQMEFTIRSQGTTCGDLLTLRSFKTVRSNCMFTFPTPLCIYKIYQIIFTRLVSHLMFPRIKHKWETVNGGDLPLQRSQKTSSHSQIPQMTAINRQKHFEPCI